MQGRLKGTVLSEDWEPLKGDIGSQLSPVERCAFIRNMCRAVKCMSFVDRSGYKPSSNGSRGGLELWKSPNFYQFFSHNQKKKQIKIKTKWKQYACYANALLQYM